MKSPQWLRRAACAAGIALTAVALTTTPVADAQSVLSEPDFSGMFAPGGPAIIVARDSSRGWNYVFSGTGGSGDMPHINGISVGRLSRVSDSGNVDLSWVGPDTQAVQRVLLLGTGDLLVLSQVSVFQSSWKRLRQISTSG